jgi:hypothetical protein
MLRQIRNQSQNVVVLVLFGMLIFVFIFFFGLPSQGGNTEVSLFNQWGAKVEGEELSVSEARLYAMRRDRRNESYTSIKTRLEEMVAETAIDHRAEQLGFVSNEKENAKFVLSAQNLDVPFFVEDDRKLVEVFAEFKKSQEEKGQKVETLPVGELLDRFLNFIHAGRPLNKSVKENFENAVASWGLRTNDYLEIKGKENRIRQYLSFMNAQILGSEHAAQEQAKLFEQKWIFSFVKLSTDLIVLSNSTFTADQIAKVQKDRLAEVEAYYKKNIDQFSKTKLQVNRITARYADETQKTELKALMQKAKERLQANSEETPDQIAKSLSTDTLKLYAYDLGLKTRKESAEDLFNQAIVMSEKAVSEVQDKDGFLIVFRLDKKEAGEELSLEQSKATIAQKILEEDAKLVEAENKAKDLIAQLKAKKEMSAWVDTFNQSLPVAAEGTTRSQASVSQSGEITVAQILSGDLSGMIKDQNAADLVLAQIFKLSASDVIATPIKFDQAYYVLQLKEKVAPVAIDADLKKAKTKLQAQSEAQKQFLGDDWLSYILLGPSSFDVIFSLPQDILQAFSAELQPPFMRGIGGKTSFLDQSLASKTVADTVVYNPLLTQEIEKQSQNIVLP